MSPTRPPPLPYCSFTHYRQALHFPALSPLPGLFLTTEIVVFSFIERVGQHDGGHNGIMEDPEE
ncbi:hypothetical protein E2C01_005193 [Portunus trituberculatus]|uniref:Uncharacterized protein n=1 Tax=Portunus trituberculatus TaxID=210409 RepID=A0A5B7CUW1_PORTR|nr:hypothetical protein [Portunus trituberculatus]